MKKTILLAVWLLSASLSGYAQFSNKGFYDLKLGMSKAQTAKLVGQLKLNNGNKTTVTYKGVKLDLTFEYMGGNNQVLFSIYSASPSARVERILSGIVGKPYKEVKAIIGNKMQTAEWSDSRGFPRDCVFYRDQKDKENYESSCVLRFNDKGILEQVIAAYNP